ncbi:hypothetical protein BGW38_010794 [Lunasporangiospora selenospora]|uniref:Phosphatidic acid phosphatase type 2/haloperoxidase domain-containing protein n=1 Tax=Lunasporangiospora selenospora TaxID=979761 RepID=A0A9P6KFA4_9FUNG|nr:hypothetical protein BGW38_010794 [Lunasporangiospora selenospora]
MRETTEKRQPDSDAFIVVNGADDRDAGIYSDHFYSKHMTPLRSSIRRRMIPWVRSETKSLAALQERWRTPFLDSYFTLTAFAGHPLFFVCILPIMFWYGHSVFARGFVNVACVGVFVTSWVKDFLCLPRPLSPPLVRLSRSKRVHLEYGFPSTHTTNATSIALYLLSYLLISDWSLPSKVLATLGLATYLFSIIFGRLYCGMHTRTDIIGGLAIGTAFAVAKDGYQGIVDYDPAIGWARSILRFVFGLAVVFGWRMVAKKLLYILLPPIYRYFNLPSRTHFVPAKTYGGDLRRQPIGRVPSVMDIHALADSEIEIVGPQSTMDIHEQFSQTRSSKRSSLIQGSDPSSPPLYEDVVSQERFGIRPNKKTAVSTESKLSSDSKGVVDQGQDGRVLVNEKADSASLEDIDGGHENEAATPGLSDVVKDSLELDESERRAMEKFEAEHPGWARFDVDIVIKTVVYGGIGWLAVDTIPVIFEYIGLGTSSLSLNH